MKILNPTPQILTSGTPLNLTPKDLGSIRKRYERLRTPGARPPQPWTCGALGVPQLYSLVSVPDVTPEPQPLFCRLQGVG